MEIERRFEPRPFADLKYGALFAAIIGRRCGIRAIKAYAEINDKNRVDFFVTVGPFDNETGQFPTLHRHDALYDDHVLELLKDAKQKTPGRRIVAADVKPAGKGPATGGATPASAPPINYAPAAPAAPPWLYDPPATARVVALSPPPVKAPPSPTIRSRPKAASAWRIQIAAVASAKAAKKEWQRIASANDDLLSKLKLDIRRADLGARGVFYRVQAGPLTSKSEARDLCTALKERKERCFIVPAK